MRSIARAFLASSVLTVAVACGASAPEVVTQPPPPPAPTAPPVASAMPVGDAGSSADAGPPVPATVAALQSALLSSRAAADTVASLTTEVGPRLAGSPGNALAVTWAVAAMKARGLANVHTEKVMVRRWERGEERAAIVAPVAQKLMVTALGWSGATPARGVEADVVRFESLDALKSADASAVAKKIVFLDVHMRRTADGHGYGEAVPARARGPAEAAKKGALAIVVRSIGTDHTRFPHTGAIHQEDEKSAIPAGALSVADADLLARVIATKGSARLSLVLTPKWLPDAESANVVGEVTGREKPDEVVLLGAHLDSWDLAQGAIDDGAGCAIVLEAARAIGALPVKPRRTVRVVLFAAEENSLAGAKEYARAHAPDAAKIVAAMEADTGTDRVLGVRAGGGPEQHARFATIAPYVAPLEARALDGDAYGGADVGPLRTLGVPLIDLEQDMSRYFDTHHTANDTFDQIDADALAQVAAAFASVGWGVAEMEGDLGRVPEGMRKKE